MIIILRIFDKLTARRIKCRFFKAFLKKNTKYIHATVKILNERVRVSRTMWRPTCHTIFIIVISLNSNYYLFVLLTKCLHSFPVYFFKLENVKKVKKILKKEENPAHQLQTMTRTGRTKTNSSQ